MPLAECRLSWAWEASPESLSIQVDTSLYSLDALLRTCYVYTDRCYLFLERSAVPTIISVRLTRKTQETDLSGLAGEFGNELINQKLRREIAEETRAIRELIVTQAFTEADLLGRAESEADYLEDPRGIGR